MTPFEYRDTIIRLSEIKKDNLFLDNVIKNTSEIEEGQFKQTKLQQLKLLKESNKDIYNHLKYNLN